MKPKYYKFPNFQRSLDFCHLESREATLINKWSIQYICFTIYTISIINNHVPFYLQRKKNLLKFQKVPKFYDLWF